MMKNITSVIRVAGLRVVRSGRTVLAGLDLVLNAAEVTGVLGPSGCGKSTLMRSLVGVQQIQGGEVEVLGRPSGSASTRAHVGYVTQSSSVYGNLTVAENLHFFAAVLGAPRDDVDRVLSQVDLGTEAAHLVSALSGGQRNRVSLAVALLGQPTVLVLDEPTVGLDPVLRRDLWDLFHRLAADGAAVIVSSHVMDEAERCDRLLLMREGQLIADETPAGLLARTGAADVEDAFLQLVERPPLTRSQS